MEIHKIIRLLESKKYVQKIKISNTLDNDEYILDVYTKIANLVIIKKELDKIVPNKCTYLTGDIITGKGIYYPGIVKYDKKLEFFTIKIKK